MTVLGHEIARVWCSDEQVAICWVSRSLNRSVCRLSICKHVIALVLPCLTAQRSRILKLAKYALVATSIVTWCVHWRAHVFAEASDRLTCILTSARSPDTTIRGRNDVHQTASRLRSELAPGPVSATAADRVALVASHSRCAQLLMLSKPSSLLGPANCPGYLSSEARRRSRLVGHPSSASELKRSSRASETLSLSAALPWLPRVSGNGANP